MLNSAEGAGWVKIGWMCLPELFCRVSWLP